MCPVFESLDRTLPTSQTAVGARYHFAFCTVSSSVTCKQLQKQMIRVLKCAVFMEYVLQMLTDQDKKAPFEPPVSACGLACLLMLLEEVAQPRDLFGGGGFGPDFAVQTLDVRELYSCLTLFPSSQLSLLWSMEKCDGKM